ncbi:hypothetical protein AMATHDRAFT_54303 [Amanita thiersii Skay4041]|uniref:PIG-P domain-containing protein n=1 Tax=Amanita thiersii Skay4041 TaxID=703135 RepID=A0A2A9P074_9AGAR|nr:hypothetical protein AMATHDRAFT_54303 [Amanita thiersii Skay4041]
MATENVHRSRAPEFYGFVAWTSTALLFLLYLAWALLPDKYIISWGIHWYPNREWAILLPSWTIVLVLFTYFTYSMLAIARTPPFSDLTTITDTCSDRQIADDLRSRRNPYIAAAEQDALPQVYDIPVGMVTRVLYGGSMAVPSS